MTETGCKVLFTAYDDDEENRAELPREHLRIAYPYEEGDDDDDEEEERRGGLLRRGGWHTGRSRAARQKK